MTTYREVKDNQLKILETLKAINGELKVLRDKVRVELDYNKEHKTHLHDNQDALKILKGTHATVLKELQEANKLLATLRGNKEQKAPRDNSTAKAAREAVKAERQAASEAKKVARATERAAESTAKKAAREQRAAEREARREARAEELEAQGRPARGYNFPLLTDLERETSQLMNKVFAKCAPITNEIHDRKRAEYIASL